MLEVDLGLAERGPSGGRLADRGGAGGDPSVKLTAALVLDVAQALQELG